MSEQIEAMKSEKEVLVEKNRAELEKLHHTINTTKAESTIQSEQFGILQAKFDKTNSQVEEMSDKKDKLEQEIENKASTKQLLNFLWKSLQFL